MPRVITLQQAKAQFTHRFTMEYVPHWAHRPMANGKFYAPQYRTDQEWYDNTQFPGEGDSAADGEFCVSNNQTWPLGRTLRSAYARTTMTTPVQSASIYKNDSGEWSYTVHWVSGTKLTHNTFDSALEAVTHLTALLAKQF